MADRFTIHWDPQRPILYIYQGAGAWSDDDFDSYEAALLAALAGTPAGGFEMLLDQTDTTVQSQKISDRRNQTLGHLLSSGMQRAIVVVPQAVVRLQTDRVHRQSGADKSIFHLCQTRAEALALLDSD